MTTTVSASTAETLDPTEEAARALFFLQTSPVAPPSFAASMPPPLYALPASSPREMDISSPSGRSLMSPSSTGPSPRNFNGTRTRSQSEHFTSNSAPGPALSALLTLNRLIRQPDEEAHLGYSEAEGYSHSRSHSHSLSLSHSDSHSHAHPHSRSRATSVVVDKGTRRQRQQEQATSILEGASMLANVTTRHRSASVAVMEKRSVRREAVPLASMAMAATATANGKVGVYTHEERRKLIDKFLRKRDKRIWRKRVKYNVRKNFADSRLRVKGRFVRKEDEEQLRELLLMSL